MHRPITKVTLSCLFLLIGCQDLSSSDYPAQGSRNTAAVPSAVNTAEVQTAPRLSIVYPQSDDTDSAFIQVAENDTRITQVSAEDLPGSKLIYRLQDGPDMNKFTIDEDSGALSFKEVPDWEQPHDSDGNNNYMVLWQVLSSTGEARSQFLVVQVTDMPD